MSFFYIVRAYHTTYRNKLPLIAQNNTIWSTRDIFGTMKRTVIALVLVAIFCSVGFAEGSNSADVKYRFSSGGFWTSGQDFCGGFGEFGINCLPQEKFFVLRDCIFCQGDGGTLRTSSIAHPDPLEFGEFQVGDKLIIGGRVNGTGFIVRTYGYTSVALGLMSCTGHKFGTIPMLVNIGFGGGFEFQYTTNTAFVVEFGGNNRLLAGKNKDVLQGYSKSNPVLTIGFRTFK